MQYNKPPLTLDQQVDRLIERGLQVPNHNLAVKTLQAISYYRLSAYFLPFQKEPNKFNDGTKFEDILQLYEFVELLIINWFLHNKLLARGTFKLVFIFYHPLHPSLHH